MTDIICILFLLVVSITDYYRGFIYDKCIVPFFALEILFMLGGYLLTPREAMFGALTGGGMFALIRVLTHGGMGGGDVKLSFVLGFWLGWERWLVAMYIAFILGTVAAVVLYLRRAEKNTHIPFAPYMSVGTLVALLWGSDIMNLYFEYMW